MGEMRRRMEKELKLRGYSQRTIDTYLRWVHKFVEYHKRPAELMGTEEARSYVFDLIEERKLSGSTVNQAICAIRFFYLKVLRRPFDLEDLTYPKRKRRLPFALSEVEIAALFNAEANLKHRAILMTLYSGGLRLQETIELQPTDIDSAGMRIRIRAGKGGKERYVMLSAVLLDTLRTYFKQYRPEKWLFFGETKEHQIHPRTVQRVVARAAVAAGIQRRVNTHVLRHSFATHLLAHGTNLRYIQELLGHRNIQTTMIYTHVCGRKLTAVVSPLDWLFASPKEPPK